MNVKLRELKYSKKKHLDTLYTSDTFYGGPNTSKSKVSDTLRFSVAKDKTGLNFFKKESNNEGVVVNLEAVSIFYYKLI
jgi:hypothetical protein